MNKNTKRGNATIDCLVLNLISIITTRFVLSFQQYGPFFSWPTSINYINNWHQVTDQHFEHQEDGLSYSFENLLCNIFVSVQIRCTVPYRSLPSCATSFLGINDLSRPGACGACTHAVSNLAPINVYTCLSKSIPHDLHVFVRALTSNGLKCLHACSVSQMWGKQFFFSIT